MSVLLTYDVDKLHISYKKALKAKGYSDYWTANNNTYYLPNTTLWKKDGAVTTAKTDMQNVAATLKIKLERAIAVEFSSWDGIPGEKHTE